MNNLHTYRLELEWQRKQAEYAKAKQLKRGRGVAYQRLRAAAHELLKQELGVGQAV